MSRFDFEVFFFGTAIKISLNYPCFALNLLLVLQITYILFPLFTSLHPCLLRRFFIEALTFIIKTHICEKIIVKQKNMYPSLLKQAINFCCAARGHALAVCILLLAPCRFYAPTRSSHKRATHRTTFISQNQYKISREINLLRQGRSWFGR